MFLSVITSCNSSSLVEKGDWINIKEAPISCGYLLYKGEIYGVHVEETEEIRWDEVWSRKLKNWLSPIMYADIETFEVNINDEEQFYAKDKNNVYYPVDRSLFEGYIPYSSTFEGNIVIPNADPKTFKYLGEGYAVDKSHMYYEGKKINWDDSIVAYLSMKNQAIKLCKTDGFIDALKNDSANIADTTLIRPLFKSGIFEKPLSQAADYVLLFKYLLKPYKSDDAVGSNLYKMMSEYPYKFAQIKCYISILPDYERSMILTNLIKFLWMEFLIQSKDKNYTLPELEQLFLLKFSFLSDYDEGCQAFYKLMNEMYK